MQVDIYSNEVSIRSNGVFELGDDAEKVVWCAVDHKLELYACHKEIIKAVVDRLDAYW